VARAKAIAFAMGDSPTADNPTVGNLTVDTMAGRARS